MVNKIRQHLNLRGQSMVRIALAFWSREDVQRKLNNIVLNGGTASENIDAVRTITKELIKIVDTLLLPRGLQPTLQRVILALQSRISLWKLYTLEVFGDLSFSGDIRITSEGTLDTLSMVMNWLNDCKIDFEIRFRLACEHCLKTKIIELWSEMPQHRKDAALVECGNLKKIWKPVDKLIRYWVLYLTRKNKIYKTYHKKMLINALKGEDLTLPAAKYFWSLLNKKEQIKCLKRTINILSPCVIYFSQFLVETGEIREFELGVDWYWVVIFDKLWFYQFEIIFENQLLSKDIPSQQIERILFGIMNECGIIADCRHSQAIRLLRYLWTHSSVWSKRNFLEDNIEDPHVSSFGLLNLLINTLFHYGDGETIVLILNDEATNSGENLKEKLMFTIIDQAFGNHENEALFYIMDRDIEHNANVPLFNDIVNKVFNSVELKKFKYALAKENDRMCLDLLPHKRYTLANEFLKFVFPNEMIIEKFKLRFVKRCESDLYTMIEEIWNTHKDLNLFHQECQQLLHWLMESEDRAELYSLQFCVQIRKENIFGISEALKTTIYRLFHNFTLDKLCNLNSHN